MNSLLKYFILCFLCIVSVLSTDANAQVFESDVSSTTSSTSNSSNSWLVNPRARPTTNSTQTENTQQKSSNSSSTTKDNTEVTDTNKTSTLSKKDQELLAKPQISRPTLDGVKRGHISMNPLLSEGEAKNFDDRSIFVYYSDFNIRSSMSGRISCDVKFIVLSTLDRRINNLSIKLKWPKMETGLNFDGITPNIETYYNYTLLGDGCYTMDKTPNIIVNRCRVKGMSSQECASKIIWLRKSN